MSFAKLMSVAIILTVCFTTLVAQQTPSPHVDDKAPKLEHFDPSIVDSALDPCEDFQKFVCSKWQAANPIPPDQVSWGPGSGLQYWNESILRETLQQASTQTAKRSLYEQQIGDYWAACTDETSLETAGTRDLKPELQRIDQLKSKGQIVEEVAHLHRMIPGAWQANDNESPSAMLGLGSQQDYDDASKVVAALDQGGMGLPGRDFYLKTDDKSVGLRTEYESHIKKMLVLAGESAQHAEADAKTVMTIETSMAEAAMDNVKRRDPKNVNNKMSLAEMQALTPSFDFKQYLMLIGAPASEHYLVSSPDFFRNLEKLLQRHSIEDWRVYLRWQLVHGSAPYLSKTIVDENWNFYAATLAGAKQQLPRWRRCVRAADRDLGQALGEAYVSRAFPPESKARTVALVEDVEHALNRDIDNLDWMSDGTKREAKVKLKGIEDKIGYPDHWREYAGVKIERGSYLNNVHQATAFEFRRQLEKIGKPVDRSEWTMTPPTINAYYDAQLNTINFPAGILQPPYFDVSKDDSVNYGSIGTVIGHEIIHGFDDQGRKFDAQGNLRDWWTDADSKAYDERGNCIADEYTQEIPEAGVKQNGRLTQGEDTADNGGLHLAFMALQTKLEAAGKSVDDKEADGWTPRQRFFLSYANSWCEEYRPELMRTIVLTNPHSIDKYRVNNVVSNMPEFKKAFSCKTGAPMVHANACKVW